MFSLLLILGFFVSFFGCSALLFEILSLLLCIFIHDVMVVFFISLAIVVIVLSIVLSVFLYRYLDLKNKYERLKESAFTVEEYI